MSPVHESGEKRNAIEQREKCVFRKSDFMNVSAGTFSVECGCKEQVWHKHAREIGQGENT